MDEEGLGVFLAAVPFWFQALCLGLLGAIWGSFVGALTSRWPKGESIVSGRSACDQCGSAIAIYDLVPVFSFLLLSGKCRKCGGAISTGLVGCEIFAALIGVFSLLLLPPVTALAAAIFGWLLLPLAVLDYRHLWLPNILVLILGTAAMLAGPYLTPGLEWTERLISGGGAFLALEAIRLAYRKFRNHAGMGAGDPKLFGAIGLWLGWQMLPLTLLLASIIGLAHAIRVRHAKDLSETAFPLGCYLAASALLLVWIAPLA